MQIIAVTDDRMENEQLIDALLEIEPYIHAVILREKSKTDVEIIELIQHLQNAQFDKTKIIIHGRADIALMTGINKVQMPSHGIPLTLLKKHFPHISFGKSVHSIKEAESAVKAGADWLLYGHVFQTGSKEGLPPRGTVELFQMVAALSIPVYAIGGIKPEHLPHLHQNGIRGAAVMSTIFDSKDPANVSKAYKEML